MNTIRRLPLWRECLDEMRRQGLEYGKEWPAPFFVEQLSRPANTVQFNMGIHHIRLELEREGYYLSAAGQRGEGFILLEAAANEKVIRHKERKVVRTLKRGAILGNATKTERLTAEEKNKLRATTERVALKALLLSRQQSVLDYLRKTNPRLLQKKMKQIAAEE